jgi:hypothetical protein
MINNSPKIYSSSESHRFLVKTNVSGIPFTLCKLDFVDKQMNCFLLDNYDIKALQDIFKQIDIDRKIGTKCKKPKNGDKK